MNKKPRWLRSAAAVAGAAVLVGGCTFFQEEEAEQIEPMLSAAGFKMIPANTPARREQLKTLPPLKMLPRTTNGKVFYVFADPDLCKCMYVGDAKQYQEFQKLKLKQQIAVEEEDAAAMNEDASMDWGGWGYPWW